MNFLDWLFALKNKSATNGGDRKPSTQSRFGSLLLGTLALLVSASTAVADPNMYLPQARIDAIKLKLDAGEALWTDAYDLVIAEADAALALPLTSVHAGGVLESVTYGGTGSPGANLYASRFPEGGPDDEPLGTLHDYYAAVRLSDKTRSLGLAYAFTGEAQYADRAIELINNWSVNPATRMTPNVVGNTIEIYITMPGLFYGADLISDYGGWDPGEKAGFEGWAQTIGNSAQSKNEGPNNFANWKVVMVASVGALLHDDGAAGGYLDHAESQWKFWVEDQMNGSLSSRAGLLGREASRGTRGGLHYSLFALNAMIQGAEILRNQGVNVYDYVAPDGSSLKLGLDFIAPYALNPETWGDVGTTSQGYTQDNPITADDSMALFELAYSYYGDQAYLDILEKWGRPIDDIRPMGNTTLTHGNTFELAIASVLDGDFDLDEDVDGADFLRWQRVGLSGSALADWEASFGTSPPASTSVPEPSTGLMLLVGCGICAMRRKRQAAHVGGGLTFIE